MPDRKLAPVEARRLKLFAAGGLLFTDTLNRVALQSHALGVLLNVVGGRENTPFLDRTVTQFVHIVPVEVNRPRHLALRFRA